MASLLEVRGLVGGFGPLQVLWDVALQVQNRENVVLLGPNGAGKSTLLRTLLGLQPAWRGEVYFCGQRIDAKRTDQKVKLGISFMTESGVFANLSVEENLLLGAYYRKRSVARTRAQEFLDLFPDLALHRRHYAGALSGGQRKLLGLAKALMSEPQLVVMDEPSSGLSPRFVGDVIAMLGRFRSLGSSFLIAEQNVRFLDVADRVYVLEGGRVAFEGTPHDLSANRRIRDSYFGLGGGRPDDVN